MRGFFISAERVGFEPTMATRATTVFETVPINRSGTSPNSHGYYSRTVLNLSHLTALRVGIVGDAILGEQLLKNHSRFFLTMHQEYSLYPAGLRRAGILQ